VKYKWIDDYKMRYPIDSMCRILKVSPSGYYNWVDRPASLRDIRRQRMAKAIKFSHERSYKIYGYRKVHEDLTQEMKIECCKETVRCIMRASGLRSRVKHKWIRTTHSDHQYQVAGNILDGDFTVSQPNRVWVTDITYIQTGEGWLYLGAVMDLFGRRIIGWSMSKRIDTQLVSDALGMALKQRGMGKDLLHHSDRGSQYCSDMYQKTLRMHRITCSMSRKGNCWDNACIESFFGSLKSEWVYGKRYQTREEAKTDIFNYIEMFYNRQRRHETLGYISPVEYEERHRENIGA
jgi:putative transposase